MKKYLGNKSKILEEIYDEVQDLCPDADSIFDAFSGTTNVGQFFKKRGYSVISNDVNTTSRLMGEVYIKESTLPTYNTLFNSGCYTAIKLRALENNREIDHYIKELLTLNHNTNNSSYLDSIATSNAIKLLAYLSFVADEQDVNANYNYKLIAPNFIWRNYCYNGTNSKYFNLVTQRSIQSQIKVLSGISFIDNNAENVVLESIVLLNSVFELPYNIDALNLATSKLKTVEGIDKKIDSVIQKLTALTKRKNHIGNRMFFSEEHGRKIDVINDLTLLWFRDNIINHEEYCYLQCALVEAVALFSNTSATYQAFYKTYRENTKQKFRLVVPEIIPSDKQHHVYCEDTFKLIETLKDPYDIIYMDPPYNWRIYDSNYHLLNLISDFNNLADNILDYESGIAGAAGENRKLSRNYTNYNRRETFEELLFGLIHKAKCKYVVISYSDSLSNHNKNSLSSVQRIERFLNDPGIFVPGSFRKVEVNSIKFESRTSEKKDKIHELLFAAEKR